MVYLLHAIFQKYGLLLKLQKYKYFQESVEYLGQVVSREGVHPVRKLRQFSRYSPQQISELRSFLGMVNHYGKFIQFLDDLSAPLNKLLRQDTPRWTTECQLSFDQIQLDKSPHSL